MLRFLIEFLNRIFSKLNATQRVHDNTPGALKINLGCGLAVAPGWINVDGSLNTLMARFPAMLQKVGYRLTGAKQYYSQEQFLKLLNDHRFVHHDLGRGIPFDDSSVDFIFTSHFLEHLFERQAERLLEESFRVLKSGGVLRISVPDLSYAISLYQKGCKHQMLRDYFFVDESDSFYARHKYMYDFELLKEKLNAAGFNAVERRIYREGETPDLQLLDNRPEESLFVEARKA